MISRRTLSLATGLLAVAAAGQAQDKPNVTIYGTLIAFADNVQASDASTRATDGNSLVTVSPAAANVPSKLRITCSTSNLGFKGDFKIKGDDLKLIWQVESSVSVDGDAPSVLAGRNSAIGLSGASWGTVLVGNWDTPYKFPTLFTGTQRGLFPFDNGLTGNPGFNVPGTVTNSGRVGTKNDASFNRRQGNSIQYWTPDMKGFSARVAYSVNESKPTSDAATQAQFSPTVISALLSYRTGGLTVHYGYERHSDYFGLSQLTAGATTPSLTNASSKDEGQELAVFYAIPSTGTRLTAIVEQLTYRNDETVAGKVSEYKRTAWGVSAQQSFGQHKIWGLYGSADKGSAKLVGGASASVENLGATQATLGYNYAITKTADVFATYYTVVNKAAATYGAFPVLAGINPGADTRGFGVGVLYTF